jgi:hypothetical protein
MAIPTDSRRRIGATPNLETKGFMKLLQKSSSQIEFTDTSGRQKHLMMAFAAHGLPGRP